MNKIYWLVWLLWIPYLSISSCGDVSHSDSNYDLHNNEQIPSYEDAEAYRLYMSQQVQAPSAAYLMLCADPEQVSEDCVPPLWSEDSAPVGVLSQAEYEEMRYQAWLKAMNSKALPLEAPLYLTGGVGGAFIAGSRSLRRDDYTPGAGSKADFLARERYYETRNIQVKVPEALDFGQRGHIFSHDFMNFLKTLEIDAPDLVPLQKLTQKQKLMQRWGHPEHAKYSFLEPLAKEYHQKITALHEKKVLGPFGQLRLSQQKASLIREYHRVCEQEFYQRVYKYVQQSAHGMRGIIHARYLPRFESYIAGEYLMGLDVREISERVGHIQKWLWSDAAVHRLSIGYGWNLMPYIERFVHHRGVSPGYMKAVVKYWDERVIHGLSRNGNRLRLMPSSSAKYVSHPAGEVGYLLQKGRVKNRLFLGAVIVLGAFTYIVDRIQSRFKTPSL